MVDAVAVRSLKGLALPAIRGAGGYFASKNRYDTAWGDIINAVFTPIGSRPMNRLFGSAIHRLVEEPLSLATTDLVSFYVKEAAAKWCPHIVIESVDVNIDTDGRISMGISFSLAEDRAVTQDRLVQISKSNIISVLHASRG